MSDAYEKGAQGILPGKCTCWVTAWLKKRAIMLVRQI